MNNQFITFKYFAKDDTKGLSKIHMTNLFEGHINVKNIEYISNVWDESLCIHIDLHTFTYENYKIFYIQMTSGKIYFCLEDQYSAFKNLFCSNNYID